MQTENSGTDISRSALLIVDMQNDFLHPAGSFGHIARQHPEANIDLPFLVGTIPQVKRLLEAFRRAGRPVVYIAHVMKPDYSDAAWPCASISTRRTATERTVSWGRGARKSSTN